MKIQKFYFIFVAILTRIMFVGCDKNDLTVNSEVEISTTEEDNVVNLEKLYEDLQPENIDNLTKYLEERIEQCQNVTDEVLSGLRVANLSTLTLSQQIIQKEYVDPYFVQTTVSNVPTVAYKGNFNFQTLINDSRLSLNDREMILVAYKNIDEFLPLDPVTGLEMSYCMSRYKWELYQISVYYFTLNFMTFAPILQDYLAAAWNSKCNMNLITNNHYNDVDAAESRYADCVGRSKK
jgi:hypothetical protein